MTFDPMALGAAGSAGVAPTQGGGGIMGLLAPLLGGGGDDAMKRRLAMAMMLQSQANPPQQGRPKNALQGLNQGLGRGLQLGALMQQPQQPSPGGVTNPAVGAAGIDPMQLLRMGYGGPR